MSCSFLESTSLNLNECPGNFIWDGSDNKYQYKTNKKIHGNVAPISNNITYTLNSYGYRCPEFNKIDWPNSIITLGCSNTFGVGVDNTETYSNYLQESLNIPVINLGQGGTDLWYQIYNAKEIMKLNVRGVILQVPSEERFTVFGENRKTLSFGSWNIEKYKQIVDIWGSQHNLKMWHSFGFDYIQKILGNKLLYNFSFSRTDNPIEKIDFIDQARDNMHPGPRTHQLVATRIAKELQYELN